MHAAIRFLLFLPAVSMFHAGSFRLEVEVRDAETASVIPSAALRLTHRGDPALYDREVLTDSAGLAVFEDVVTGVAESGTELPHQFKLYQNYPNPFNPSTVISFSLPVPGRTVLDIYDLSGRRVRRLADAHLPSGFHTVPWNAADDANRPVSAGVYLLRLHASGHARTIKMVLMDGGNTSRGNSASLPSSPLAKTQAGEPYILTIRAEGYQSLTDSSLMIDGGTGLLTYALHPERDTIPPVAKFTINPDTGYIHTTFHIDATESTDNITPQEELTYRIQWETGKPYTDWSSTPTATHTYNTKGPKTITLEVRDQSQNTGATSLEILIDNMTPQLTLNNTEIPEDTEPCEIYNLREHTTDDIAEGQSIQDYTYELTNQTNPELIHCIIENGILKFDSIKPDASGETYITVKVTDPEGASNEVTFRTTVTPEADITGTLKDPILKKYAANLKITLNEFETTTDDSGRFKIQIPPGQYTLKTDTTGGRMQTSWNLGNVGTEDIALDTILTAYKNDEQMRVLIDVRRGYGPGDGKTYATNRIWDPEKTYAEELPKGTLKTLYVNTSIIRNTGRWENLKWAVEKIPEGTGGKIRLQHPEEADTIEIEVNNETDEGRIMSAFDRAETYEGADFSQYNFLVMISKYAPDLNSSNANVIRPEYATRAVTSLSSGNLGPARANALSEMLMPIQNAEDAKDQGAEEVLQTLYGRPIRFNHEDGYVPKLLYGPEGQQILIPREKHIGDLAYNLPLNTTYKLREIILPPRK